MATELSLKLFIVNVAADEIPFVKYIFIVLAFTAVTFTIVITMSV